QVHLEPTDAITAVPRDIDVDAAIGNALANRLDLLAARRQQEITTLGLKLDEDLIRPDISVSLNYLAQGQGGTQFGYGSRFPPPIVSRTDRGFGSVLGDAIGGTYASWTGALFYSHPIGRSAAKATLARDRLQKQQEDLTVKDLEVQIAAAVR